ncbi:MAG: acylphosphatase [Wenzhouxiangella sp.]
MAAELRGWRVSGRVQRVFFRESTRREAVGLGLAGYAVNLADGRVEVAAQGRSEALDQLEAWLHQGPQMARVDGVERFVPDSDRLRGQEFFTG